MPIIIAVGSYRIFMGENTEAARSVFQASSEILL